MQAKTDLRRQYRLEGSNAGLYNYNKPCGKKNGQTSDPYLHKETFQGKAFVDAWFGAETPEVLLRVLRKIHPKRHGLGLRLLQY